MTASTPQPDAERVQGEVTAAVERAGEAIFGHDDSGEDVVEDVRRGLAAALDVEEMARVLHDESEFADAWEQESQACRNQYLSDARALRAALLGGAA